MALMCLLRSKRAFKTLSVCVSENVSWAKCVLSYSAHIRERWMDGT